MAKQERAYCNRPHVLLLPYPSQGHVNPMLQFAKRLEFKGTKATLAITIFINNKFQFDAGTIGIEAISDGCDEGGFSEAGSVDDYLKRLEAAGPLTLAELMEKLNRSGNAVTCLIYDAFLPWALDVAKRFNVTAAAFFTQACIVNAIYYHVYHRNLSVPLEIETVSLPGLPSLQKPDMPSFVPSPATYPHYAEMVFNQFCNLEKADWVLLNTFDKLESEVVKWMAEILPARAIGPTVPSVYLDNRIEGDNEYSINLWKMDDGECMKWLDEKATGSVVFASFGSMAALEVDQMEELAWGFRRSNKHFLWVVREPEMIKLPLNFTNETAEMGLLVTWGPQMEILAHKAVGCFVTHCGWNSVTEALSLGMPMVGVPQWTDQPTDAKCVEDVWKVGLKAKADEKGIVRRDELERCIREVMEGERSEEFKKNAMRWRELAKEAVDEGGSSDKNIDELIASLLKK